MLYNLPRQIIEARVLEMPMTPGPPVDPVFLAGRIRFGWVWLNGWLAGWLGGWRAGWLPDWPAAWLKGACADSVMLYFLPRQIIEARLGNANDAGSAWLQDGALLRRRR